MTVLQHLCWTTFKLIIALALLRSTYGQDEDVMVNQDDNLMEWNEASDRRALCNDFSRAGFFLRRNSSSPNWIIFLESGSLCFSSDTCNRRFFRDDVRGNRNKDTISADAPFGNFDVSETYERVRRNGYSSYVNPLMTSMKCLNLDHFNITSSGARAIEGRDFLSTNDTKNGDFAYFNHVLIPYCSSDLWLASEDDAMEESNCSNFRNYTPNSQNLQFTFRGKLIFQSIFKQLMEDYDMRNAESVILGGSSAGGVGVVNLAQWASETLPANVTMSLVVDSAWFVNYQGNIARIFGESVNGGFNTTSEVERQNTARLKDILFSHQSCRDTTFGFPCCISAQCMLTRRNSSGQLAYFPEGRNVRSFFLSSIYDVYLLAPTVAGKDGFDQFDEKNQTQALVNFLLKVGEYGGEMNRSFTRTSSQQSSMTYYLTQCFQHIYFATSSLWGENTVFNTSSIGLSNELASFEHSVQPGRWQLKLASDGSNSTVSVKEAIHLWYHQAHTANPGRFLDTCQSPYCNSLCPDKFALGKLKSNDWPTSAKIAIAAVVVGIGVACLLMKLLFKLWLYRLEKKQDDYLEQLEGDLKHCDSHLVFPECDEEKAVAVSCLDLNYKISYKTSKKYKDERTDKTEAVVLNELTEQQKEVASSHPSSTTGHRVSRQLHRRSKFVQITENLISTFSGSTTNLHDVETGNGIELTTPPPTGYIPPAPPPPPLPDISALPEEPMYNSCGCQKTTTKHILKDVSIYFNPGEMIGIMGPSGCGKTTFLDLLTGRRKTGTRTGNIYINGIPMEEIQDWYVANTGYVLQLARPFYEEMTVRDNLTLAAEIKLPVSSKFTTKEKFKRVEQVMEVTGLAHLADTVVGGETGPGLSGGQKRRLVVALQLLRLPSVIFLDEPTSGLDATSSMELLSHLNKLADSQRTVILTIHQPRLEIFHMFHKLVLLSDGKVAYHGAPEKSYEVFVSALRARYLEQGLIIPSLEDHNPADVIMDMLGNPSFRRVLTEYYQDSQEPKLVRQAIKLARFRQVGQSQSSMDSLGSAFGLALHGARRVGRRHANMFVRMAALEARAGKRLSFFQMLFLPFMFFMFATVLGTVYLQQEQAFLVISGMCVFSVASGLFVFPAIEPYYTPAIRVYRYEREDGVGRSGDLVIQGFVRYISLAFLPVILSCTLVYLLLIHHGQYDGLVFVQVVLVNMCLNFVWTALLIALLMAFPTYAFRISSAIASVAGFTSGFFIPINDINWVYRWIAYINPNYYGLSSVAFLILEDFNICNKNVSELVCYLQSGPFTLRQFFFDKVNPYFHICILLGFMTFFLGLGIFVNWVKDTSLWVKLRRAFSIIITNKPVDELSRQIRQDKEGFERSLSINYTIDDEESNYGGTTDEEFSPMHEKATTPLYPIAESEEEDAEEEAEKEFKLKRDRAMSLKRAKGNWRNLAGKGLMAGEEEVEEENTETEKGGKMSTVHKVQLNDTDPSKAGTGKGKKKLNGTKITRRASARTPFLREGETHFVWRPKKRPMLSDLVEMLKNRDEDDDVLEPAEQKLKESEAKEESFTTTAPPKTPKPTKTGSSFALPRSGSLRTRQQALFNRVIATQAVLKESTDELLKEDEPETPLKPKHMSLFEASKKVTANLKKQKRANEGTKDFSDIVSEYIAKTKAEAASSNPTSADGVKDEGAVPKSAGYKSRMSMGPPRKPISIQRKDTKGAIPISQLREIVKEGKMYAEGSRGTGNSGNKRNSAGPYLFTSEQVPATAAAATGSSGATPSASGGSSSGAEDTSLPASSDTGAVMLDPPPPKHNKTTKMAKLKKDMASRRPQRPEDVDSEVLSSLSNMDRPDTLNITANSNNNNNNNNNNREMTRRISSVEFYGGRQRELVSTASAKRVKSAGGQGRRLPTVSADEQKSVGDTGDVNESDKTWNTVGTKVDSNHRGSTDIMQQRRHSAEMYLMPKDKKYSISPVTSMPTGSNLEVAQETNMPHSLTARQEPLFQQSLASKRSTSGRRHSCAPMMQREDWHHKPNVRPSADSSDEVTLC